MTISPHAVVPRPSPTPTPWHAIWSKRFLVDFSKGSQLLTSFSIRGILELEGEEKLMDGIDILNLMDDLPQKSSALELKKYERQNIKRRYGCDWHTYLRSYELQEGKCAMCDEPAGNRGLKADTKRRRFSATHFKLLCPHCYYIVQHWAKDSKRAQIRAYLCLDDPE